MYIYICIYIYICFVCLFVCWNKPNKLYSASSWEGSKPPGSGHTRAEAQNRDVHTKDSVHKPTYLSIYG